MPLLGFFYLAVHFSLKADGDLKIILHPITYDIQKDLK